MDGIKSHLVTTKTNTTRPSCMKLVWIKKMHQSSHSNLVFNNGMVWPDSFHWMPTGIWLNAPMSSTMFCFCMDSRKMQEETFVINDVFLLHGFKKSARRNISRVLGTPKTALSDSSWEWNRWLLKYVHGYRKHYDGSSVGHSGTKNRLFSASLPWSLLPLTFSCIDFECNQGVWAYNNHKICT